MKAVILAATNRRAAPRLRVAQTISRQIIHRAALALGRERVFCFPRQTPTGGRK